MGISVGILGALNAAISGLQAQSFALQNISGNIANSQTTAYKRVDTTFQDLVGDGAPGQQVAGNVIASAQATNNVQGDVQASFIGTFMAINGEGFFIVGKPSDFVGNSPVFSGGELYTRRGDFQRNADGYLVNGAGYYLMGIPIDRVTGDLVGGVPVVLQFSNDFLPAQPTTQIDYRANLPSLPQTPAYDPSIPGSELLNPSGFTVDPTVAGAGTVVGDDLDLFLAQSVSGGAITVYDSVGTPVSMQLRWAKIDSTSSGGTDTWNLFYQVDADATGTSVAWQNAGVNYTFDASGRMNPPIASVTLNGVTVEGVAIGDVQLLHGSGGITQFSDTSGTVQVNLLQQDGIPAGELQSVSVNDKGRVVGSYSNGRTIELAEIVLADFNNPNGLKRLDGGAFEATAQSGPAILGASGRIIGGSLEGSNTDIADEFSKLIITQQAYSANTKVITTGNQMLQDLLNMIR
jgi:flagellar hook protein FlgE